MCPVALIETVRETVLLGRLGEGPPSSDPPPPPFRLRRHHWQTRPPSPPPHSELSLVDLFHHTRDPGAEAIAVGSWREALTASIFASCLRRYTENATPIGQRATGYKYPSRAVDEAAVPANSGWQKAGDEVNEGRGEGGPLHGP